MAVTMETESLWAQSLPPGTAAQRAEPIALTQALLTSWEKDWLLTSTQTTDTHLLMYMKPFPRSEGSSQQKEKLSKIKMKFYNSLKPS